MVQTYMLFGDPATRLKGEPIVETQIIINPGVNLFGLPNLSIWSAPSWKAMDLLEYMNNQGIKAQKILTYDSLQGIWLKGIWEEGGFQGTNFEIIPGQGYLFYICDMEESQILTLTGSNFYLDYKLGMGFNFITFPAPLDLYTSYDILKELGKDYIDNLRTYLNIKGEWKSSYYFFNQPTGGKYQIRNDNGYIIWMINTRNNWRPSPWDRNGTGD